MVAATPTPFNLALSTFSSLFPSRRLDLFRQRRQQLVQITNNANRRQLQERGIRVAVDDDDRLRTLHPDRVLDRAGDARADVELRTNRLPGLANLLVMRTPAEVRHGPRRPDRRV